MTNNIRNTPIDMDRTVRLDEGVLRKIFKSPLSKISSDQNPHEATSICSPLTRSRWKTQQDYGQEFLRFGFFKRLLLIMTGSAHTKCVQNSEKVEQVSLRTKWAVWKEGPKYSNGRPQFLLNKVTNEPFLNESHDCISKKMLLIFLGYVIPVVPLFYVLTSVSYLVSHTFSLLSRSCTLLSNAVLNLARINEVKPSDFYRDLYSMIDSSKNLANDIVRIVKLPFILLGFLGIAIVGLDSPYEARAWYGALERNTFDGHYVLAPCFQSFPTMHLFAAPLSEQNGM